MLLLLMSFDVQSYDVQRLLLPRAVQTGFDAIKQDSADGISFPVSVLTCSIDRDLGSEEDQV